MTRPKLCTICQQWHEIGSACSWPAGQAPKCAGKAYESNRYRMQVLGRWQPFVDAEPVRRHVRALQADGLGTIQLSRVSGVSHAVIRNLLYSRATRPPSRRIRPATARRICAVSVSLSTLADNALVPAIGTQRRLQALVAIGWTQTGLAAELGMRPTNLGDVLRKYERVYAATARAVRTLYERLWDSPPLPSTGSTRAVLYAQRHGWARPMAWDDEKIDDPNARPYGYKVLRREATFCNACSGRLKIIKRGGVTERRCLPCANRRRRVDVRRAAA